MCFSFFNARYKQLGLREDGSGITFANWMAFALPMSAITLVLGWVVLMLLFLRLKSVLVMVASVGAAVLVMRGGGYLALFLLDYYIVVVVVVITIIIHRLLIFIIIIMAQDSMTCT